MSESGREGASAGGPPRLGRRVAAAAVLGIVVYAALASWKDLPRVGAAMASIPAWAPLAACALSLANYAVRFPRWQRYLHLVGSSTRGRASVRIYLSGLALTVSPGKVGEALKSWSLREHDGTPLARSAPIVIAERVTDLFGFLALIVVFGSLAIAEGSVSAPPVGLVGLALALGFGAVAVLTRRDARRALVALAGRITVVRRKAARIDETLDSSARLVAPRELPRATALAALGWGLECFGAWVVAASVVDGPLPTELGVAAVGYAFALAAVAGALVVIAPGGLGVTEGLLAALLASGYVQYGLAPEEAGALALSVTIVVRLCTLWFAMAVGLVALSIGRRGSRSRTSPPGTKDLCIHTEPSGE